MNLFSVSETLTKSINFILKIYCVSFIFAIAAIIYFPNWLKWSISCTCTILFLMNIVALFVEHFIPREWVKPSGKAVFITGCDSGFGHMLALRLDGLGLQVFAGCLYPEGRGASTLKESSSSNIHIIPLDVRNDNSIESAVKYVAVNLKNNKLWAVVNNAGISDGSELFWTNNDIIQNVFDVNTFGVVKVTKAFLPLLLKFKGRVIAVTSAAARNTYPNFVSYCMSKHAAQSFCDGLRLELYKFGVQVVTVEPFIHRTPIIADANTLKNITIRTWESAPQDIKNCFPNDYLERNMNSTYSKIFKSRYTASDKPQNVVNCLMEGIMAVTPMYSYCPGTITSKFSCWILRLLPKPLEDLMLTYLTWKI